MLILFRWWCVVLVSLIWGATLTLTLDQVISNTSTGDSSEFGKIEQSVSGNSGASIVRVRKATDIMVKVKLNNGRYLYRFEIGSIF